MCLSPALEPDLQMLYFMALEVARIREGTEVTRIWLGPLFGSLYCKQTYFHEVFVQNPALNGFKHARTKKMHICMSDAHSSYGMLGLGSVVQIEPD